MLGMCVLLGLQIFQLPSLSQQTWSVFLPSARRAGTTGAVKLIIPVLLRWLQKGQEFKASLDYMRLLKTKNQDISVLSLFSLRILVV